MDDGDRMYGPLEILMPFLQCQDYCKVFMVIDAIVLLGGCKGMEVVGAGM